MSTPTSRRRAGLQGRTEGVAATWSRANIRLLEVFACVADAGTMSEAGNRLGITQAAVSQSIAALEEALRVQLFDRSVRPPALTLVGRTALRSARQALESLREVDDVARYGASGKVALLRLGVLNSFASTAGVAVLQHLRDVADEWSVTSGYEATTFQALTESRVDVVITSDESPVPHSVDAVELLTERFVVVAPASWSGPIHDLARLSGEIDFIRFGREAHMSKVVEGLLSSCDVHPPARYRFDTTDAVLQMVAGGFGWTIVPPLILLKSGVPLDALRLGTPSGAPIWRTVRLAMRADQADRILQRIRLGALDALRHAVLPRVQPMLERVPGAWRLASESPRARRRGGSR
jgi:DNA-binding transcriptional LysR family regulator